MISAFDVLLETLQNGVLFVHRFLRTLSAIGFPCALRTSAAISGQLTAVVALLEVLF